VIAAFSRARRAQDGYASLRNRLAAELLDSRCLVGLATGGKLRFPGGQEASQAFADAAFADAAIKGELVRFLPPWVRLLVLGAFALAGGLLGPRLRTRHGLLAGLGLALLALAADQVLALAGAPLLESLAPAAGAVASFGVAAGERRLGKELRRHRLKEDLARRLSPARAAALGEAGLEPRRGQAAVLALRYRGLARAASLLPPERAAALLAAARERAAEAALGEGGCLAAAEGETWIFSFGLPLALPDAPRRAASAALAFAASGPEAAASFAALGAGEAGVEARAGLDIGDCLAGCGALPGEEGFALVGAPRELARALASLGERLGARILATGAFKDAWGGEARLAGRIRLEGGGAEIACYEPSPPRDGEALVADPRAT
jgi:class 3 adenylate cyclase